MTFAMASQTYTYDMQDLIMTAQDTVVVTVMTGDSEAALQLTAVINQDPGPVGLTGYDFTGMQALLSRGIFPTFPETGKDEGRIVFHPDRIRDFFTDHLLPFVESVWWDQAAPFPECLAIRGRRTNRLDARIDRFVPNFRVFRPLLGIELDGQDFWLSAVGQHQLAISNPAALLRALTPLKCLSSVG
jgi:hypothetical protein